MHTENYKFVMDFFYYYFCNLVLFFQLNLVV